MHDADSRPQLFDATSGRDRDEVAALVDSGAALFVHDTLADQLTELLDTRDPGAGLSPAALQARAAEHLGQSSPATYGTWVFYPWSRRLVHILPEVEFLELRSSRNRNKISAEEQAKLRSLRIGVVGLSVGQTTVVTLAMEGIGHEYRLADFDGVSLSNLNRLRCGLHELGMNKAAVTARHLSEIDPYASVDVHDQGITEANLDAFLAQPRPLDLLFEQSDSFFFKVHIRERARHFRIPVLMDTNDRGILDVERFDLEPDRPVLHGLLGDLTAEDLRDIAPAEKMRLALAVIGNNPSPRLAQAFPEIGKTLKTWPQLASDVSLGAALNVEAARRIALGTLRESGRFTIDLEELIADQSDRRALQAPR